MKLVLCFILTMLSYFTSTIAQNHLIEQANQLLYAGDPEGCQMVLDSIKETDFQNMTDFDLFRFHYLQVVVPSKTKKDHEFTRNHNEACKKLMETSVGVWGNPYYPEVIWSLAYDYVSLGFSDEALYTLEEGITKCVSWIYSNDTSETASYWYSSVVGYTADLYEKKGWNKHVVSLYESAFDVISRYEDKLGKGAQYLRELSFYYNKVGDHNNSISYCQKAQDYLSKRGLSNTLEYAEFLYQKSISIYNLGDHVMAYDSIIGVVEILANNDLLNEYLYSSAVSLAVIYAEAIDIIGTNQHLSTMNRYRQTCLGKSKYNDYVIRMEKYIESLYRNKKEDQGDIYSTFLLKAIREDLPDEDTTQLENVLKQCKHLYK